MLGAIAWSSIVKLGNRPYWFDIASVHRNDDDLIPLVDTVLPTEDAGSTILIRLRDTESSAETSNMNSRKKDEELLDESGAGPRTAVNRHFPSLITFPSISVLNGATSGLVNALRDVFCSSET